MKRIICLACLSAMLLCMALPQTFAASADTEKPTLDAPEATVMEDDETVTASDMETTDEDQNDEKLHVKMSKDIEDSPANTEDTAQE